MSIPSSRSSPSPFTENEQKIITEIPEDKKDLMIKILQTLKSQEMGLEITQIRLTGGYKSEEYVILPSSEKSVQELQAIFDREITTGQWRPTVSTTLDYKGNKVLDPFLFR